MHKKKKQCTLHQAASNSLIHRVAEARYMRHSIKKTILMKANKNVTSIAAQCQPLYSANNDSIGWKNLMNLLPPEWRCFAESYVSIEQQKGVWESPRPN